MSESLRDKGAGWEGRGKSEGKGRAAGWDPSGNGGWRDEGESFDGRSRAAAARRKGRWAPEGAGWQLCTSGNLGDVKSGPPVRGHAEVSAGAGEDRAGCDEGADEGGRER